MEAKGKRKAILWISALVLLGVGGFVVYRKWKKKQDSKPPIGDSGTPSEVPTQSGSTPSGSDAERALATAYRIWANSTEELSKKYGKKSQFDLDSSSSNPYNKNFLDSYAVGKADYEKSKASSTASTPSAPTSEQYKNTPWNKLPLSYQTTYYPMVAKSIHERLWQYTGSGTKDDSTYLLNWLKQLKHGNDFLALYNAFGKRCYRRDYSVDANLKPVCDSSKQKDLVWWLRTYMDAEDKLKFNSFSDALRVASGHSPTEGGFSL